MPYTKKQRAFFGICAHAPAKARKKCPKPAEARRMLQHKGVKRPKGR